MCVSSCSYVLVASSFFDSEARRIPCDFFSFPISFRKALPWQVEALTPSSCSWPSPELHQKFDNHLAWNCQSPHLQSSQGELMRVGPSRRSLILSGKFINVKVVGDLLCKLSIKTDSSITFFDFAAFLLGRRSFSSCPSTNLWIWNWAVHDPCHWDLLLCTVLLNIRSWNWNSLRRQPKFSYAPCYCKSLKSSNDISKNLSHKETHLSPYPRKPVLVKNGSFITVFCHAYGCCFLLLWIIMTLTIIVMILSWTLLLSWTSFLLYHHYRSDYSITITIMFIIIVLETSY